MTALGENPVNPVGVQLGVVTPPTPARDWCPNDGPRPRWLPPDKFHCGQDHYLQGAYGITCEDYWELFVEQLGRCAICGQPPGSRRLVVDHDHDTGTIDGLCHFGCNRRLHTRWRRYLADPPGRVLGLKVAPAKLKAIQQADKEKRKRDQERRTKSRTKEETNGPTSNLDRLRAMTQGGT